LPCNKERKLTRSSGGRAQAALYRCSGQRSHRCLRPFSSGNEASNVVLIGWLESENRPATFAIDLVEGQGRWRGVSRSGFDVQHGTLEEHPIIAAPCPSLDELLGRNIHSASSVNALVLNRS
jgi:hypothetical protein